MDIAARRIAIVGGSAGMGFAAARVLALGGASIAIIGRDQARAEAKAAALTEETGADVRGYGLAAGDPDGSAKAIANAAAWMGGLDGLAVTAGPMQRQAEFVGLDDADWVDAFETQLMTVVRAARAGLPLLIESRGSLVTTAAYSVHAQKPTLAHYTAMKAAIVSVTKNVAKTYGPVGVRANCIAPGAIATEALDGAKKAALERFGSPEDSALNRLMAEVWGMNIALGRVGQPQEVGELIAFLLSDQARYMTGAVINIDGGTDF